MADEQAGFRRERSTIEQIVNLRVLCEKILKEIEKDISQLYRLQKSVR